jgi:hypothetical protein
MAIPETKNVSEMNTIITPSMEYERLNSLARDRIGGTFTPHPDWKGWYLSPEGWPSYGYHAPEVFTLIDLALRHRSSDYEDNDHRIRCPKSQWVPRDTWSWWSFNAWPNHGAPFREAFLTAAHNLSLDRRIAHSDLADLREVSAELVLLTHAYVDRAYPLKWWQWRRTPSQAETRVNMLEMRINNLAISRDVETQ